MSGSGAGAAIGPYVVVSELGRGGMGLVLRARHAGTGAEVALKVLDASLVDAEAVVRFDLEGDALAKVAGDGIVPVHAAGQDGRQRWIALGLMGGGSLRDRMKTSGAWPWERAVELVRGLAVTLGRCHAAGIVHRDLKPENILFDDAGRAHVADFGLVRDLAARALTLTGTVLGTPAYMAPEQLEGLRADARADVWALAVILHELVAGERPWVGKQTVQLLARITATPRPRLAERGGPPELDAVLDQALTLDVAPRYPDAATLAAELARVLAREVTAAQRAARARSGRRRVLGALALAALLALVGAGLRRVDQRRARLLGLAQALGEDVARLDSWRADLRAARCAGEPVGAARLVGLEEAVRTAEDHLQDPAVGETPAATARARLSAGRGRLELAVARGSTAEARATAAGLAGVPREEDAHLRLLAELAAPAVDRSAVERELGLARGALAAARGEHAADLRLAAARGHLALGQAGEAATVLGPAFATAATPTRGELLLRARCAGALADGRVELARFTFDRAPPPDPGGEELGAAALDGYLARLAGSAEADLRRQVELAWDFELDYRERWRRLEPGCVPWPRECPYQPDTPPVRPSRTLLRPRHAPELRAALAALERSTDARTVSAAARCWELLAVADPAAPLPARTFKQLHAVYEEHATALSRLQGGSRSGMARTICVDLCDQLRVGMPTNVGAIVEQLRKPLRLASSELLAEDGRDWAREALMCTLELFERRNFFEANRERQRAALRRPLVTLAASRLLSPAARAAVALEAAEHGLAQVGHPSQRLWAQRLRALPWELRAPRAPGRRERLTAARALLEAHRPASTSPDQFDCVLAQLALVFGERAEAERLAWSALDLAARRGRGEPLDDGRPLSPRTVVQPLPATMRKVLGRALREQGREAEAKQVEAGGEAPRRP